MQQRKSHTGFSYKIFGPTKFKNATKPCYELGPYQAVIVNSSTLDLHVNPPLMGEVDMFL